LEDEEFDAMGAIKDFAVIAGYIVAAMAFVLPIIVITLRSIGKARDKRKPDAQYTHQDATQELDAWESGDTFETRGGIDEQKVWGEDPLEDEEPSIEGPAIEELGPDEENSSEPEYVAEEMSIPSQEEEVEESSEQPEQPPAEAPPLPSGGLPEGWTMDQWRWYGHQWLERHGNQ
jgi:hypothetical protein